jgi:protein-tyrosine phosphatase
MGNICRSPMAERLLVRAVRERLAALPVGSPGGPAGGHENLAQDLAADLAADLAEELVHSHSAGTGGWHAGEEMNPPAGRQVRQRGADPDGFAARKLRPDLIDGADLVLTATADQRAFVVALRPDAAAHTFVMGEFGRLLAGVDAQRLPPGGADPEAVHARGVALVAAVHRLRADAPPLPGDDLDDPWGRGDHTFGRVADEIEHVVRPLVDVLLPLRRV